MGRQGKYAKLFLPQKDFWCQNRTAMRRKTHDFTSKDFQGREMCGGTKGFTAAAEATGPSCVFTLLPQWI